MRKYELEVVRFEQEDVIATSNGDLPTVPDFPDFASPDPVDTLVAPVALDASNTPDLDSIIELPEE